MNRPFLPFHLPDISEDDIAAVVAVMRSGWLTTGARVKEFEAAFAETVGARHAVAVNSATAAMHLALEAFGLQAGDEVIIPTNTFTATGEVVCYFGAKPVLVDIDAQTLNMDPAAVARAITPKTRAIIPVHFAGLPCDMDPIMQLAAQHGLHVIEDAAHAFPAQYRGRTVGTIGDVTCFSFYATKTITTGEGGMATTDNAALADRMRIMSMHGISRDAWKRYTAEGSWFYEVIEAGFKYNLTDMAAALGLAQLARHRAFYDRRVELAARYTREFADCAAIELPAAGEQAGDHAWHLYVIKLRLDQLTIDRAQFISALKDAGIGASVHFIPLHFHPFYRDRFGYAPNDLPRASEAYQRVISLPLWPGMTDADADRVVEAVHSIAAAHRR